MGFAQMHGDTAIEPGTPCSHDNAHTLRQVAPPWQQSISVLWPCLLVPWTGLCRTSGEQAFLLRLMGETGLVLRPRQVFVKAGWPCKVDPDGMLQIYFCVFTHAYTLEFSVAPFVWTNKVCFYHKWCCHCIFVELARLLTMLSSTWIFRVGCCIFLVCLSL